MGKSGDEPGKAGHLSGLTGLLTDRLHFFIAECFFYLSRSLFKNKTLSGTNQTIPK
jgi:hypothetical protein